MRPPMIGHGDADEILGALPTRRGHFLLESGYHTDLWISLDGLFRDPTALAPRIASLAGLIRPHGISAVCGPLLGGAFLAQALAIGLGVRFYRWTARTARRACRPRPPRHPKGALPSLALESALPCALLDRSRCFRVSSLFALGSVLRQSLGHAFPAAP